MLDPNQTSDNIATAKAIVVCDHCKIPLKKEEDTDGENIQAVFPDSKGEAKTYHFCDHKNCLRMWLNQKAKLLRRSKASFLNGAYQLDFTPIEFSQKKLW